MRNRFLSLPLALGLASAVVVPAQDVIKDVQVQILHGPGPGTVMGSAGIAPQNATFEFIAAEPGIFGKVVAGAPYSGEGFTEVVQTLADGTRIVNKHSKKVWRDGQGRTRDESTLPVLGPWASQGGAPLKLVTISDPVAKVIYLLNEKDKTVTKRKMPDLGAMKMTRERHEVIVREGVAGPFPKADILVGAAGPAAGAAIMTSRAIRIDDSGKEEPLGTQTLEGLKVEGKRQTNTIAAGEVGNDRALVSVVERWTSPELQVLVRMTTKDPQMGESTYRLTNISRTEPAAALFQVPADYTVKEANEQIRFQRFERK